MNPQLSLVGAQESVWSAITTSIGLATMEPSSKTAYRPQQWSYEDSAPKHYISLIDSTDTLHYYFFDATLKAEHTSPRRLTEFPVQTGAEITDHSYKMQSTVIFEVGVSDVMDSYDSTYDWIQFTDVKSVNAFQTLLTIQDSGLPLTLQTRLKKYENMLIESIITKEDNKTKYSMIATITFKEIIVVQGAITKTNSAESFTTNSNQLGAKNTAQAKVNNEGMITGLLGGKTLFNYITPNF